MDDLQDGTNIYFAYQSFNFLLKRYVKTAKVPPSYCPGIFLNRQGESGRMDKNFKGVTGMNF